MGRPHRDRHEVGAPVVGALFNVIAGPKIQRLNRLVSVSERQRRSNPFLASLQAGLHRAANHRCAFVRLSAPTMLAGDAWLRYL
jgi:hypothetical protein